MISKLKYPIRYSYCNIRINFRMSIVKIKNTLYYFVLNSQLFYFVTHSSVTF